MNIGRAGRSGGEKKPLISGVGMYVYWLIELGIVGVMGFLPAVAQAKSLFCEPCGAWYQSRPALGIALDRAPAAAAALEKKDWTAFAACAGTGGVVTFEKCPSCEKSPIGVVLESVAADAKGKETRTRLHESLLAREEANALLAAMAPKNPDPPPAG